MFENVTNDALIRQWWYEYRVALTSPLNKSSIMDACNTIFYILKERGLVAEGNPMLRAGAQDLASECDAIIKKRMKH